MNTPETLWESDYQFNERFTDNAFTKSILSYPLTNALVADKPIKIPADVPSYLRALYYYPLLTREGEWSLFMKMNCAKYHADLNNQRIAELSSRHSGRYKIKRKKFIDIAITTRNDIANHNLRLVANLAKKQYRAGWSVEDWMSNGNISLLKAIEKFDCNKPNPYSPGQTIKFGTYATWAITKNFWRDHTVTKKDLEYSDYKSDELPLPDKSSLIEVDDPLNEELGLVFKAMEGLDKRERQIVFERHGIKCKNELTLTQLGSKYNVSKERIRQIELSATIQIKEKMGLPLSKREIRMLIAKRNSRHTYDKKRA